MTALSVAAIAGMGATLDASELSTFRVDGQLATEQQG
jgi:hypothetical protein